MIRLLTITTNAQGLHEITADVNGAVRASGLNDGLCTLFIRHTSASLLIQENADPAVRADLEHWLGRLVPENDALYTHLDEGPDDMPAHIKTMLTATSLSIPISDGRLALGRWQGVYVWEHRHAGGRREIVAHLGG